MVEFIRAIPNRATLRDDPDRTRWSSKHWCDHLRATTFYPSPAAGAFPGRSVAEPAGFQTAAGPFLLLGLSLMSVWIRILYIFIQTRQIQTVSKLHASSVKNDMADFCSLFSLLFFPAMVNAVSGGEVLYKMIRDACIGEQAFIFIYALCIGVPYNFCLLDSLILLFNNF